MLFFGLDIIANASTTLGQYQLSYTAEAAKTFTTTGYMNSLRLDLDMIKENNGRIGFYKFDSAKCEHYLLLGDLQVNKSCENECKPLERITCQGKCIKVTNFTHVGKRKDIQQDVVAISPIFFNLHLCATIAPILLIVVYFYWLCP